MSDFPSCDNATYIDTMYKSENDQLANGEILAASNCEYLLRAEPNELCLYSVSEQQMLYQWYMHNTIWDIKSNSKHEILNLNNTGCLTWFNNDTSIYDRYCDPNNGPTTTYYSTTSLLDDNSSEETEKSMNIPNEFWIPLSVTIIAVIFALIFLIAICRKNCNKNRNTEYQPPSNHKRHNKDDNKIRNDVYDKKNDYDDNSMNGSQIKYGLNVPVRYENESENESEIDTENDEIKENEIDINIDYNKSESLMVQKSNNKTFEISISDLSDSSDDAPEPEIVNLKKMKPTKVNKKGENKFDKFKK